MPRPERPLDDSNDAIAVFAGGLRRLRVIAGSPGYRQLALRAHYSASSLSEAASGRRFPSLEVTLAYVRACDGDIEEWETRWRQVAADTTAASAGDVVTDERAPYLGLRSFGTRDAHRFHGRDRLLERLRKTVLEQRLVIAVGASGAGKSSLLSAGLVAVTRSGGLAERRTWPDVVISPGPRPLESCAVGLAAHLSVTATDLHTALTEHPRALVLLTRQILAEHGECAELLFVVDQFEEIFTLCRDDDERDQFIDRLVVTAADPTCRIRIVLGVRADFYGHCARYPGLASALQEGQVLVGPMTSDELREAITRPAIETGCRVETALVSRLIADAVGQPGPLPLLSHALLETWRRRHGTTLTLAAYDATGGIHNAIAHTADMAYTSLSPGQQVRARQVFERLIALGEGTEDTKRRLPRTELDHTDADLAVVLERLAAARLLVLDETGIEIAHEALIRSWPRLRDWLAEDREGLRTHRQLTEATNAWEALGQDEGVLYRGTRLAIAEDWATPRADTLTTREHEFLDTSRALRDREQASARRRARRLRQLVTLLIVLLVLASAALVYAVRAERTATDQRNIALSQKVAGQAATLRSTKPALAAELALAAYQLAPTMAARSSLISTVATAYATSNPDDVCRVILATDGRTLIIGDKDGTVLMILTDSTHPARTAKGLPGRACGAVPGPNGHLRITGSWKNTLRQWDITDQHKIRTPVAVARHENEIDAVALNPDGRTLAVATDQHTVRLLDVRAPAVLATLTGHTKDIQSIAFSRDGHLLVTTSWDHTARLWDVTDPRRPTELAVLTGHTGAVLTAAISPDGRTLVTSSLDRTIRLWDITNPRAPHESARLNGHTDTAHAIAFSPDGQTLATAANDHTARLWDLTTATQPRELAVLTGHADDVRAVAFMPDGHTLITGSADQTVRLWETDPERAASQVCTINAYPQITTQQWKQYLPGIDYRPPCV